jgi:hypothetical protein
MRSQTYAVFTVKKEDASRDDAPPLAKMEACPPAMAVVGRNLTKRFRDLEAVRFISFDVPARLSSLTSRLNP